MENLFHYTIPAKNVKQGQRPTSSKPSHGGHYGSHSGGVSIKDRFAYTNPPQCFTAYWTRNRVGAILRGYHRLAEFLMPVLNTILVVLFVIVSILLILLVLVQNEEGDSFGGVFAGGGGSAFGSRSGNILSRASSILGGLFLVLAFVMALLSPRGPQGSGVEAAGRALITDETPGSAWWDDDATETGTDETPGSTVDTETDTAAEPATSGELEVDGATESP
jgi:preprotein translocase subunit SecG